jgi:hypothetical protein
MEDPRVVFSTDEFGEQGGAGGATAAHAGVGGAGLGRASVSEVHEEAELVVEIQFRVVRLAEAHPVALTLLVVFALVGDQRGAVTELKEASEEVGVEAEVA